MTNGNLAQSYLLKAEKRLKVLQVLYSEEDYSDVVREAQEIVELCVKGMLRFIGVEPPKLHDVGPLLVEHEDSLKLKNTPREDIRKIAKISKELRKERELAFYGDIDFIPTEEYTADDANKAIEDARFVVEKARGLICA